MSHCLLPDELDKSLRKTTEPKTTIVYEGSNAELSGVLRSVLMSQKKTVDIMIPEKALDASHMMMVPHNHLQFKMSYDLFDLESIKIQAELEKVQASAKQARIFAK